MLWAKVEASGKSIPLDQEPAPRGRIVFVGAGTVRVLKRDEVLADGQKGYTSHFATCPDADQHRLPL